MVAGEEVEVLNETVADLVLAGRILSNEGVIDSFGHISVRHPKRPDRFLMPRVRAAELVEADDILEFDLTGAPHPETQQRVFSERVIHSCIYRLRPDVMAVCHHHASAMLPFCVTDARLMPVFHLGATMGVEVPLWDSQTDFGDTNLLVSTDEQGRSLAHALGQNWTVLMRGHGTTVAARSVREVTFRSIYGARNADLQLKAMQIGVPKALTRAEALAAEDFNLTPFAMDRAWEQWARRAGMK